MGLCVQLLMNVPFTAVHFSAYETAKKFLATEDDENLGVQLVAGGFAGGLSAACTNPLDVIKTRLQTDGLLRHRRQGVHTAKVSPPPPFLSSTLAAQGHLRFLNTELCKAGWCTAG